MTDKQEKYIRLYLDFWSKLGGVVGYLLGLVVYFVLLMDVVIRALGFKPKS